MLRRVGLVACLVVLLAGFGAQLAQAAPIVYTFTTANTDLGPVPYGTITVDQTGSTAVMTVDMADGVYLIQDILGWNLSGAPSVTATGLPAGVSMVRVASLPYNQMSGFGRFQYYLDGPPFPRSSELNNFTFTLSGVTSFVPNSEGVTFAAHAGWTGGCAPGTDGCRAINTGFVRTNGSSPPVPEPASLVLLGTGLLGVGYRVRSRLRKK